LNVRNVNNDAYILALSEDSLLNEGDVYLGCYSEEQGTSMADLGDFFDADTGVKVQYVDVTIDEA
jgi:hypothetical protein